MKDCYNIIKKIEVCGTLDQDESGAKYITVEQKDSVITIPFDEIIDTLMGQKIFIKSEEEI